MKSFILFLLIITSFASAQARSNNLKNIAVDALIDNYISKQYINKDSFVMSHLIHRAHYSSDMCADDKASCIDAACNKLPSYDCDSVSDLEKVAGICLGQANGDCLNEACENLPSYDCDSTSDLKKVANACKGNYSGACLKESCEKLPSYDCNSISDIEKVGKFCVGVDAGCIEAVCSKLPSYDCDSVSDLQKVAKICKGN